MSQIPITPVTRGHIDLFQAQAGGQAQLRGWIFREDTPIDRIDITLQNKPWISSLQLYERPDLKTAFESVIDPCPHISRSGYDVTAPLPMGVEANARTIVGFVPYTAHSLRLDPLQTYCWSCQDELDHAPKPPVHLQERVGGSKDFLSAAAQIPSLILTCAGKYKPVLECEMILDWGCGCGRVITQMMKFVPPERLYGCDIDSEALGWDRQNIHGPSFTRVDPYPPTPYSDASFDLVYGISVMTHLDEETQLRWLQELKRITRSGAILALSVIGERLRSERMPASLVHEFAEKGFASFVPDYSDLVREFSHQAYYQEAYHTVDYIASNWGRYFDVLEYVETKHQDIVILRRT